MLFYYAPWSGPDERYRFGALFRLHLPITESSNVEMSDSSSHSQTGYPRWKLIAALAALILGIGMIASAWWITGMARQQEQRGHFFQQEMKPLLQQEQDRNHAAIERGKHLLDEKFEGYSARVPKFVEELVSWSSKYKITKAIVKDKWNGSGETQKYVIDLFAETVISDVGLKEDLNGVVLQFRSDLEANRNRMLADAKQRLHTSHFPVPASIANSSNFADAFTRAFAPLLDARAKQVPMVSVLSIGGSILAEAGTQILVTGAIRLLTAELAVSAAAAGGATATGAVAGGTGGTIAEPVGGTVIGIAVGVVVGGAVDWWMEARFKARITDECRTTLSRMRDDVWGTEHEGLQANLRQLVEISRETNEQALRKILVGGAL